MKISKYQYAREEMGLIFGVWLWEWVGIVL
jgi:hypothetical protein